MELFCGPVIHSNNKRELIVLNYAEILVVDGKIQSLSTTKSTQIDPKTKVTRLGPNQFVIPGLIDTHIHPVQYPNLGLGLDKHLLEWLETYTFPQELKYSDQNYASKVMDAVVKKTLASGTTTACYFASLYTEASTILAKTVTNYGQRAFIGKVNMNCCRNDGYYESTKDSIINTKEFIENVMKIGNPLVKPVITPRFALSCDIELMKQLGDLAREKKLHIQTHISENTEECKIVQDVYKDCPCYAAVYDKVGLLNDKTILAHAIYLTDKDLKLIKDKNASIAHCPSSNTFLKSGLCDVQRLLAAGIKVGLGTDISGGPGVSIMDAMKNAIQVSNHISFQKPNYEPLTLEDAFYLATLGGAAALSLDDQIGNFEPTKQFDALIIDASVSPLDHLQDYTLKDQLSRFIYSGDDRNIIEVIVAGRKVKTPIVN